MTEYRAYSVKYVERLEAALQAIANHNDGELLTREADDMAKIARKALFVVIFLGGICLLFNFLYWWVALPLAIAWFVLSFFLATKIGEKTFDRWDR